jgi:Co/Zn/Cd efflux system component
MVLTMERIKKYRRWFGWAFVASLVLVMAVATVFAESRLFSVAEIVALIICLTSFLGFVVTTLITWRKERRESAHGSIELNKKGLELEKLRREISDKNAVAQEKRKKTSKRRRIV